MSRPKREHGKVIFDSTGTQWLAVPMFLLDRLLDRGFDNPNWLRLSAELRFYLVVLMEAHREGSAVVTIDNDYLKRTAYLDRNYFPQACKRLVAEGILRSQKAGLSKRRYEVLGATGQSLRLGAESKLDDPYGKL